MGVDKATFQLNVDQIYKIMEELITHNNQQGNQNKVILFEI